MVLTRRAAVAGGIALGSAGRLRSARAAATVRVGSLQFGTVMWELDTIRHHRLDEAHGFALEVRPFGGNDAADVALMGEAVDAIVEDWLWVGRQRADGARLTFIPYSSSVGGVMARADGPVRGLADLAGRKLGVAGGPLDKSWVILQSFARQRGQDLAQIAEPVFGAPPLLAEKARSGELDAVLNYWNWCARLEAIGFVEIASVADAIAAMGVPASTPQLGYVVREPWADEAPDLARAFAAASRAAKDLLARSDAEWQRLRPLTKAEDDRTLAAFRDRWRAGIVRRWGETERADAARLFTALAEAGGERLVGRAATLPEGTFWSGVTFLIGEARRASGMIAAAADAPPATGAAPAPTRSGPAGNPLQGALIPVLSLAALVACWGLASHLADDPRILPGPGRVGAELAREAADGVLLTHLGATLARVACGFTIAMSVGIAIGIAMGRAALFDQLARPWLVFFLNLPALVTIVLCYIWVGLNEAAVVIAVAANKIPNVVVTIREGARALDPALLEMARVYRFGRRRTLLHVVLPQLYPFILAAARSGLALIWKIVLVVELLGRSSGVGFEIGTRFSQFDVPGILAYALAFILVVQAIEWLLLQPLDRRINRWRRS